MYGLIKLHSRLDGDLQQQQRKLEHVRAVIKIIDPNFDFYSIKPKRMNKRNPLFKQGEAFLLALDVLREASEPIPAMEIAIRMLAKKGVSKPTEDQRIVTWNGIKNTLDRYDGKAVISIGNKRARRWSVKN
jgi:hypothetical protein